jgi:hypothetical protein
MTNITPQSTQTGDEPTSPSKPQRLVLEEKSKGCSPPAEPAEGEDKPHEREDGDVPRSSLSDADQKMDKVYGDHVHQNPGTHLSGGIANNAPWQERWLRLVSVLSHAYGVPSGAVGKRFVERVVEELKGIKSRKWNSVRFLVLQFVILQRSRYVKRSRDV